MTDESTDAGCRDGVTRSSDEISVMEMEQRGLHYSVDINESTKLMEGAYEYNKVV